jgi:hypothetical protein
MENTLKLEDYRFVSPPVKIPEELIEKWGGEYGCPVTDDNGNLLGWAVNMPQYEGQIIEAISIYGELSTITG